jgi:glycosyltransferase involved in cell wall biosynthesis
MPEGLNLIGNAQGRLPLRMSVPKKLSRFIAAPKFDHELGLRESKARTRAADREMTRFDGQADLFLMMQGMLDPDPRRLGRRYVIWTDWTFALRLKYNQNNQKLRGLNESSAKFQFEAEVAQRAEHVFSFSEVCRNSFVKDYGVDPSKASVAAPPPRLTSKAKHAAFTDLQPTAVFVGNDFYRKGGDVLLEAWPQVRDTVPDAKLIICGPRRIGRIPEGVELRGRVGTAEVQDAYRESTLFVLPAREEPHAIVIDEAFAHGLPVIGTRGTGGTEGRVRDNENGLLVSPEDPDGLAQAMTRLLANPDRSWAMGDSARTEILATKNPRSVVEAMLPRLRQAAFG